MSLPRLNVISRVGCLENSKAYAKPTKIVISHVGCLEIFDMLVSLNKSVTTQIDDPFHSYLFGVLGL